MDIAATMLEVARAKNGTYKTKMMYEAFLSYPQLKEYLALLLENKLLEEVPQEKSLYRTTDRGKKFLDNYKLMYDMLISSSEKKHGSVEPNANAKLQSNA